jgi:hypothetical protein
LIFTCKIHRQAEINPFSRRRAASDGIRFYHSSFLILEPQDITPKGLDVMKENLLCCEASDFESDCHPHNLTSDKLNSAFLVAGHCKFVFFKVSYSYKTVAMTILEISIGISVIIQRVE